MNLTIIDVSCWTYRHFHASGAMQRSDGTPTSAVNGCSRALWNLMRSNPHHICAVFDHGKLTWRNEVYPDYKANRQPTPEALAPQLPLIRRAIEAFGVTPMSVDGFEADDVIAAMTRAALAEGLDVTIVSSDKDLMQLVTEGDGIPGVRMHDPISNTMIGAEQVMKRWGVRPAQMGDLLALMGDTTDNIPGVPGCGAKTAAKLLTAFGNLDALIRAAPEKELVPPLTKSVRGSIVLFKDEVRRDRLLTGLKDDVPLALDFEALRVKRPDSAKVAAFLDEMELVTLRDEIFGAQVQAAE